MPITKKETLVNVRSLIEVARQAPSVHNIQPWEFHLHNNRLELLAHHKRCLHAGDPTFRGLWISLGIMFETVLQTAASLGIKIEVEQIQTDSLNQPIVTFVIGSSAGTSQNTSTLAAIQNRYTYRGKLSGTPVSSSSIENLRKLVHKHFPSVKILATYDQKQINLASQLTKKGLLLAFSSPEFRHELSDLIRPNWTKMRTGLPGFVLKKGVFGTLWERWSVGLNLGSMQKAEAEAKRVASAPLLLFVATSGDVPPHWFMAGQAYALTTIELTRQDLVHSTITAPIEAADYHEELEAALNTKLRLQSMLTVGYPLKGARSSYSSPRLSVDELLVIKA